MPSARAIAERSSEVDAVIVAGDLATMRKGLLDVLQELRNIQTPTILVPGNNESLEELQQGVERVQWSAAHVLHGTGVKIADTSFFGLGGGIPITPFGDWSWDLSEDDARQLLEPCPERAVLVSHSPPKGLGDRTSMGASVGSEAVRQFISDKHPQMVVCGHIHDSWGFDETVEETRVINAGPSGLVIEL